MNRAAWGRVADGLGEFLGRAARRYVAVRDAELELERPCAECGRPVAYDRSVEWWRHTTPGDPGCALALQASDQ